MESTTATAANSNPSELEDKLQTLEQLLGSLQEQLIRAQRLAGLGTMATMIAHEFNNILTPVVSYSQYALTQDDPELWRKALSRAFEGGQKAIDAAGQMLGYSRGTTDGETANIREAVEGSLKALIRDLSKDNIELTVELDDATVAIRQQALQQVLYNLILNARQAMLGRPGRLTIRNEQQGNLLRLIISDTGPGIDDATLPKIFDPFFTTKLNADRPDKQGTGLGLAITRCILQQAGGLIDCDSQPGHGTTFTLTLPIA